ncbi:DUF1501 domain-containing protein [Aquisphaera insulae]|uniref:DUF1501 domain-containing protein n=1 Tax=Aquisphaera insulae TaxID=2712864 RepID=UPI0013EA1F4E|nr:DUF1501 domain-containing protein [Aquisphaera insulae]
MTENRGGLPRRGFFQVTGTGLLSLGFVDWRALGADGPAKTAKARTIIQLWMGGGPSHLDTFDPKPEAGQEYCGPLKNPIATKVPGIRISESLPTLAKQADKFTIIRGFTHPDPGHETATYTVTTGTVPSPALVYPSMGSVVSYKRGYDAGYKGTIPPYVTLNWPLGRFSDSGFLGNKYKTYATYSDPNSKDFHVQGTTPPGGMPDDRVKGRRDLQKSLDSMVRRAAKDDLLHNLDVNEERAYDVILGDARKAFDLSTEKEELRQKYGRNTFGQSCLLARRLAERGVPFITVNMPGWDTHTDNFKEMKTLLPTLDQGFGTLLEDLAQRGLLETTLIVWYGEFGRTPKIEWQAPWFGGRHHHPFASCAVVAGGGFRGGAVVGQSDPKGEQIKDRPVYPWDLAASVYKLIGIEPTERLPHPQGCVAYVTPLGAGNVKSGGLLKEIM